ncbi:MAG: chorismate synthase [Kiritimatiellia bacterium]
MSNTFGEIFAVTSFGESHGPCVGAVVDGCPAGIRLDESDIQSQMDRRRPGTSSLSSTRAEADKVKILSGVENGVTLGSPLALLIENRDRRPRDYDFLASVPRPSHADFTYRAKYGIVSASGGGRASARETAARVAAGSIAERYLEVVHSVSITAWVDGVGSVQAPDLTDREMGRKEVDADPVRCPDPEAAKKMTEKIEEAAASGDSIGGTVVCVCRGVPAGWGEPVFRKMDALLAGSMLSIPAARGFEAGSGFASAKMRGSEHNDLFVMKKDGLGTDTNRSGGIQGGITNGEPVVFRVAFKPAATIAAGQKTAGYDGTGTVLKTPGRHDPCVVPRAVVVVESMAAIVLADMALISGTRRV